MKIRGNTIGTPTPRPDWNQDNPNRADYIRNKPNVAEIDDAAVTPNKTWSSNNISNNLGSIYQLAKNYTNTKVGEVINDTTVSDKAWSSKNTADRLCPAFTESGAVAICEPLEGYPLEVVSAIVEKADSSRWNSITLKQCGKNLFDFKQPVSYVTYVSSGGQGSRYGYWFVLPAGTYTMHAEPIGEVKNQYIYCALNDFNGNPMTVDGFSFLKQGTKYWTRTFTLPEPARVYVYNGLSKTSEGGDKNSSNLLFQTHNIQIEAGSVATAYEPYRNGDQWTVNFANLEADGDLLFGSYNWTTGVLDTGEHGLFQHDPETKTFTYIDNLDYVPPIVRNIPAMPDTNAFYSDCGDTTVKGKADPTKIIDKLTNAILALGGNV